MVVFFGKTHVDGEVSRPNKDSVDTRDGADFFEILHGLHRFDHGNKDSILAALFDELFGSFTGIGGWLYQNLVRETTPFHDDSEIDEHIRLIGELLGQGYDNANIVDYLVEQEVPCRKVGGWDEALIATIRRDHGLG